MPAKRSSHLCPTQLPTSTMTNAPPQVEILRITKTFIRYDFGWGGRVGETVREKMKDPQLRITSDTDGNGDVSFSDTKKGDFFFPLMKFQT